MSVTNFLYVNDHYEDSRWSPTITWEWSPNNNPERYLLTAITPDGSVEMHLSRQEVIELVKCMSGAIELIDEFKGKVPSDTRVLD